MADLIVPAGTTLLIDAAYTVAPKYRLLKMEANSTIRATVDLALHAERAEFAENCLIDASGARGANGIPGYDAGDNTDGGSGQPGFPGENGRNVTISAALAQPGGLTITTNGGPGGTGGLGGIGGRGTIFQQQGGRGGSAGPGGNGGNAGQITLDWIRAAPGLPREPNAVPAGHQYTSYGGSLGFPGQPGRGGEEYGGSDYGPPGASAPPGEDGASSTPQITWRADVSKMLWAQAEDMGPAPRVGHALAYDPERGKLVLFGGGDAAQAFGDTWEWDGRLWTQVADTGPGPRGRHGMAYDPVGRRIIVFGGAVTDATAQESYLNDTWGWDGNIWIQLQDTGPSPRKAAAMATFPTRGRVVLFSGGIVQAGTPVATDDTWEWDGVSWTQIQDTGPSARLGARMAHDFESATLLLFGGAATADTWSWDGQLWTQVADTGPAPREGHAMASLDTAVILFGGRNLGLGAPMNDSWAWMEGSWRLIQDMGPRPRHNHAMAATDEAITLFGGDDGALQQDTWRFIEPM